MKKYSLIIIVNVAVFIALLFFCELLVRLFFPEIQIAGTDQALMRDSVYYESPGLAPNSVGNSNGIQKQVDNSGFWKYSKKQGSRKKFLYLGDSITMGIGVESDSTFAGIINNTGDCAVLNPSLVGYSGKDYLNIIKKIIVDDNNKMEISKVSVFWCLNDIYDYSPDNLSPEMKPHGIFGQVFSFFKKNFKLYYFLKDSFTDRPKSYYRYDEQFYKPGNKFFKKSLENIISISNILNYNHIPLDIVLLPYEFQLRNEEKYPDNPQKLLADSLSHYGINIYDLMPRLRQSPAPEKLYLYGDGIHFSIKGHKLIAAFIKDK